MSYCSIGRKMMEAYTALLTEATPLSMAIPVLERPSFQVLSGFDAHAKHCPACRKAFNTERWGLTHTARMLAQG